MSDEQLPFITSCIEAKIVEISNQYEIHDYNDLESARQLSIGLALLKKHLKKETWESMISGISIFARKLGGPSLSPLIDNVDLSHFYPDPSFYTFHLFGYEEQQDAYAVINGQTLFAVADGVGSLRSSERASKHVIKTISAFQPQDVQGLKRSIITSFDTIPMDEEIATTLSVAAYDSDKDEWSFVSIGDSPIRVYSLDGSEYFSSQLDGEGDHVGLSISSYREPDKRSRIVDKVESELSKRYKILKGSLIIVATDGTDPFFEDLSEEEITNTMKNCTPEEIGLMLIAYTLFAGRIAVDNQTGIVLRT